MKTILSPSDISKNANFLSVIKLLDHVCNETL